MKVDHLLLVTVEDTAQVKGGKVTVKVRLRPFYALEYIDTLRVNNTPNGI